jgi:hypothetical protein
MTIFTICARLAHVLRPMQRAIWNAYGRFGEGAGTPAHTAAVTTAVDAVDRHLEAADA